MKTLANVPIKGIEVLDRFCADESGATAIEYGLIAALIGIGILGAVDIAGKEISNMWNYVSDNYANVNP